MRDFLISHGGKATSFSLAEHFDPSAGKAGCLYCRCRRRRDDA